MRNMNSTSTKFGDTPLDDGGVTCPQGGVPINGVCPPIQEINPCPPGYHPNGSGACVPNEVVTGYGGLICPPGSRVNNTGTKCIPTLSGGIVPVVTPTVTPSVSTGLTGFFQDHPILSLGSVAALLYFVFGGKK